jgi:hypothetical protein
MTGKITNTETVFDLVAVERHECPMLSPYLVSSRCCG